MLRLRELIGPPAGIRHVAAVGAAVALLAAAGCGGETAAGDGAARATTSGAPGVPFDRAFIDGMVPHHEGAIEMAEAAKAAGLAQPELVEIADAIVETQQREIEEMRGWRAEWFGSSDVEPPSAEALGLSIEEMGMQHDASALQNAEDVDAEFARMMIDHHNGAIAMAELALDRAQHEEVRQLAEEIIDAQQREIDVLEKHAAGGDHSTH